MLKLTKTFLELIAQNAVDNGWAVNDGGERKLKFDTITLTRIGSNEVKVAMKYRGTEVVEMPKTFVVQPGETLSIVGLEGLMGFTVEQA